MIEIAFITIGVVLFFLAYKLGAVETALEHEKQERCKFMATSSELAADLKLVLAQQQKTATEIKGVQGSVDTLKTRVAELEAIIAAGGDAISQELVDAVAAVKAQAQLIDDSIPDVPTPPVEPPPVA